MKLNFVKFNEMLRAYFRVSETRTFGLSLFIYCFYLLLEINYKILYFNKSIKKKIYLLLIPLLSHTLTHFLPLLFPSMSLAFRQLHCPAKAPWTSPARRRPGLAQERCCSALARSRMPRLASQSHPVHGVFRPPSCPIFLPSAPSYLPSSLAVPICTCSGKGSFSQARGLTS